MAGPLLFDRVNETTTSTGVGTVTLGGAVAGFQSFAAVGNGNTCYYCIEDGTDWEVGVGTYSTTGPTLARTTVLASSNGGAAVNFGAGTKNVFITAPPRSLLCGDSTYDQTNDTLTVAGAARVISTRAVPVAPGGSARLRGCVRSWRAAPRPLGTKWRRGNVQPAPFGAYDHQIEAA